MFKIDLSTAANSEAVSTSKLHHHLGAIAALVTISLLSSLAGAPIYHTISNYWEGFIWGIADPVINLNHLAGIVVIGLLASMVGRGAWVAATFIIATIAGTAIYLSPLTLPSSSMAIAISTIIFGMMLVIPIKLNWGILAILSVIAGLFQGYANGESTLGLGIATSITYIIGVTLTHTAIVMSTREIGMIFGRNQINQPLLHKIRLAGLACCTIGIVFAGN
jgi:urease accessory protein